MDQSPRKSPEELICLHPVERLAHDPKTLRLYCTRCYGSLTEPLPASMNMREMDQLGVSNLVDRIFAELPEDQACVIFDRLMEDIRNNGTKADERRP